MCEKSVLCVGMVCVDVVNLVEKFPVEDTDMRTLDQWRTRGGNASNNCTLLAQLGINSHFLGALAQHDDQTIFIEHDFKRSNIKFGNCPYREGFQSPNSCIIVNKTNGSRTILHTNPGLPELTLEDFTKLPLSSYSWIHFEGRNVENVALMAEHLGKISFKSGISLEVEKLDRNYDPILPHVDVVFLSKEYSISKGVTSKLEAVSNPRKILGLNLMVDSIVVCAWGEDGAAARDKNGSVYECPAISPESGKIVDTIGAGDTLIASVIASLSHDVALEIALQKACRVAGNKVGQVGFAGLKKYFRI